MAFTFGTPKTAMGFTMPTTTTTSTTNFQFSAAGGDAKTTKPAINLTFTPSTTTTPSTAVSSTSTAPAGFTFGGGINATPQFNLGAAAATITTTAPTMSGGLTFSAPTTTTSAPSLLNVSMGIGTSAAAATTSGSSLFSLATNTIAKPTTLAATTAISTAASTTAVSTTALTSTTLTTATPTTTTLTYGQLEDSINKWTLHTEEEAKNCINQARQINAWDRLLIMNGEKILSLNSKIEHVKELHELVDQDLDFIDGQLKELNDLLDPLEKDVNELAATDADRNRTYQLAETMDTQLRQMSEDLKEIIERLNEANKMQELANPMIQISRILNVHMNSLQWIDRNTTKIITLMDQVAKMQDMNKRNHEINLQRTYE